MADSNKWFHVIKKNPERANDKQGDTKQPTTEQAKLPKELTEGATVSPLDADEFFTAAGKRKLRRMRKPVTTPDPAQQSTLDAFSNRKPNE